MQSLQRTSQANGNQQESANRAKNILTITSGDTFLGRSIATYLLKESERDGRDRRHECRIRVLTKRESDCDDLKDLGAEIFEIDYDDREELREAFRDSEHVIFLPEPTRKRTRHGEKTIEAIEYEGVRNVLMLSIIGAETDENRFKNLREFGRLERYLEETFTKGKWSIFRLDFLQQFFLLWAPMIKDGGVLSLNTGDGRLAPISIRDVCRATYRTMTGRGKRDRQPSTSGQRTDDSDAFRWIPLDHRHHKKIYRLTGPEVVNDEKLVQIINDVVEDEANMIRFEPVSWEEMKKELEDMRREYNGDRRNGDRRNGDRRNRRNGDRRNGDRRDDDNDRRDDDRRDDDRRDNDRRDDDDRRDGGRRDGGRRDGGRRDGGRRDGGRRNDDRYNPSLQVDQAVSGLQAALAGVQIASAGVQAAVGLQCNENALPTAIAGMQIQNAIAGVQIAVSNVQVVAQCNKYRRGGDERNDRGYIDDEYRRRDGRCERDEERDDSRNGRNRRHYNGRFRHERPIGKHLTETKIDTIVEFFEFVKSGNADFTSNDLRDLTGDEPEPLEEFFRRHRKEFENDDDYRYRS